ncbi:Phospholipase D/Transphosphatidylase precursor [Labilithrix luteola]|uniref:Phospholipase D/Transphosphatidylase n=2 Tax=Labilithrix luteola TaxID=1391654 RepID=A0A0K1PYB2_9BACT|nr:Phospholipase D/Transphosphatidylase precursor [Labilithrix luteola]
MNGCGGARQAASPPASAAREATAREVSAASIQLVESAPLETTLDRPDVPNAADTWVAMIDGAKRTLDFAEFYASEAEGKDLASSRLTAVIDATLRATKRGVKVRFLADASFLSKYPQVLARFEREGIAVRTIDYGKLAGGILHAKYFVVDGEESFVGSQNFDWRALTHIQEMGVRVRSKEIAGALLDVLDTDWELAGGSPRETRVRQHALADGVIAEHGERLTLVASPKGWLPSETEWDLPKLVALLDGAKQSIDVQVLTYKAKSRSGEAFTTLDDALRRAASRGVHVRLLVSEWSIKPGSDGRKALDDLAHVKNVDVRAIVIPPFSGGEIPFARVAHAKYMIVDGAHGWVGTSNWEGDYFDRTRNVGIIADGGALPTSLERFFEGNWTSGYVSPLKAPDDASAPRPASTDSARR